MPDHQTECSNLILSEPILNSNAKRCPKQLEPMVRISGRNLVDQPDLNFDNRMMRESTCCDRTHQDLLPTGRRIRSC